MAEEKIERPLGTARMKVRSKDVCGVSFNGRSYEIDKSGFFFVRPEDINAAMDHGHLPAYE